MKISDQMKDFIVGFPVVVFFVASLILLLAKLGPSGLILIGGLVILGFMGASVGAYIRENFRIWK